MADRRVAITGSGGRMGRMLVAEVHAAPDLALAGGSEAPGSPLLGRDIGELAGIGPVGLTVTADAAALIGKADIVIDFTTPAASVEHARLCAERGAALVVGTTGLDATQATALEAAAKRIPVVWAPNMSPAVTLLQGLVAEAARRLGEDYDIEVLEMHHRHKVDAPSGTALALGRAAADGRGIDLAGRSQRVRDGHTGPRKRGDIGFATLRGGDVVGDHSVIFAGEGERLELTHRAGSRRLFALGALRAARWVAGRKPGLYGMKDVLGLSEPASSRA
ncbi:MAG TPA: 4-hydroxy-tetrahydrodipicolinate reductase [Stellaceae bacterium]|nr:4-hydroxy-tetrahydrodipicolinate reductase [Stellaceae bacterium]